MTNLTYETTQLQSVVLGAARVPQGGVEGVQY